MSIVLANVTKKVRLGHVRVTYTDLNVVIPDGARMALLGRPEAGLDSIVDLICAADAPDAGRVTRTQSISWPIPSSHFLHKHNSLAANARFIARLYERDEEAFIRHLDEIGKFGESWDKRADQCPNDVRSLFCFLLGVSLPFDHYLLTGVNAGPRAERERNMGLIEDLAERAGIVLIGSDTKSAQALCTTAYVFNAGTAVYYDDMEAALEYFNSIEAKPVEEDDFLEGDQELQDLVGMDF